MGLGEIPGAQLLSGGAEFQLRALERNIWPEDNPLT